jgi:hypothetical protein
MLQLAIGVNPNDASDIREAINVLQWLLPFAERVEPIREATGAVEPIREATGAVEAKQPNESSIPQVYSGNELRKLAAEKAKQIGAGRVKAFVASLGLKTITEVAPEDSAEVYEKLRALQ